MIAEPVPSQIPIIPPISKAQELHDHKKAIKRTKDPIAHIGISLTLIGPVLATILGFVSAMRLKEAALRELKSKLYNGEISEYEFSKRVTELNAI